MKPALIYCSLALLCLIAFTGYLVEVLTYPVPGLLILSLILATGSLTCLLTLIFFKLLSK